MSDRLEIPCKPSGYHMLNRRVVSLALESGALRLSERGETRTITRAECQAIDWVGHGRMAPLVPLPGLILDGPGGPWIVATIDTTVALTDPTTHATPAPHVWVEGPDLALMAAACGLHVQRREPLPMPAAPNPKTMMLIAAGLVGVGMIFTVVTMLKGNSQPTSCAEQRPPEHELYPRLSCQDARAELDRVARGEATPRAIVLRPTALTIDAPALTGPATILCDGITFPAVDAQQADPSGPIVYNEGPHAVLVDEQADGTLRVSQYCICCNSVRGER